MLRRSKSATTPGSCHNWMEHEDRSQAYDDGWLLHTGEDPAQVEVLTLHGWALFTDSGHVVYPHGPRVVSQEVTW